MVMSILFAGGKRRNRRSRHAPDDADGSPPPPPRLLRSNAVPVFKPKVEWREDPLEKLRRSPSPAERARTVPSSSPTPSLTPPPPPSWLPSGPEFDEYPPLGAGRGFLREPTSSPAWTPVRAPRPVSWSEPEPLSLDPPPKTQLHQDYDALVDDLALKFSAKARLSDQAAAGAPPCWDHYKMEGTKMKGGHHVPNCVPCRK